ncbi:MAG TPA: hypothetical protein ENI87_10270 [bacterium]|nr:hypothetical protein [bacterium]
MPGTTIAVANPGAALRRFAVGLRCRHAFGRGLGALVRSLLLLAVPAVPLMWLWPSRREEVLVLVLALVVSIALGATALGFLRGRRILAALQQSLGEAGDLGPLPDELATWLELDADEQGRGQPSRMLRWLERDVAVRLEPHRRRALAAVARPRLGRFRWLVPLVVLLLLAWWLASWWQPPWSGAFGGAENRATSGDAGDAGEASGAGEGDDDDARSADAGADPAEEPRPDDAGAEERPAPAVPPGPEPEPEPEPEDSGEIPPLVDRPDDQRFVLPEFLGDGPTRRERMHVAELVQSVGASAPTAAGSTGGADPEPAVRRPEVDFARAAERAQHARHVPPAERAIVRRFFEQLQRRGRRGGGEER